MGNQRAIGKLLRVTNGTDKATRVLMAAKDVVEGQETKMLLVSIHGLLTEIRETTLEAIGLLEHG